MKIIRILLSALLVFSIIVPSMTTMAAGTTRLAVTKDVTGNVHIKKSGGKKEFKAKDGFSLRQGDSIRTEAKSSTNLVYDDGTKASIGPKSKVIISKLKDKNGSKQSKIKVVSGKVWNSVENLTNSNDEYEIETPTAVMGVRGTLFLVSTDPLTGNTKITVLDGEVGVSNNDENSYSSPTKHPDQIVSINETTETNSNKEPAAKVQQLKANEFVQEIDAELLVEVVQDIIKAAEESQRQANELKDTENLDQLKNSVTLVKQAVALSQIAENLISAIKSSGKGQEINSLLKNRGLETLSTYEKETKEIKDKVKNSEQEIVQQAKAAGLTDADIKNLSVRSEPTAEIMYAAPVNTGGSSFDSNNNSATPPSNGTGTESISGKVYIQDGQAAPVGGLEVRVEAERQVGGLNWCEYTGQTVYYKTVTIPEGQTSANYSITNLAAGQYKVRYNVSQYSHSGSYYSMYDLYYSTAGVVNSDNAAIINTTAATNIDLQVSLKTNKIKGKISLPIGETTTNDLAIRVHASSFSYSSSSNMHLNASKTIVIPAGQNAVQYELTAPVNTMTDLYNVSYSIESDHNDRYDAYGTYSNDVDIVSTDANNVDLTLKLGVKITGTISLPDGDVAPAEGLYVTIETYRGYSKYIKIPAGESSAPFTLVVRQNQNYELGYWYGSNNETNYYIKDGANLSQINVELTDYPTPVHLKIQKGNKLTVNMSLPQPDNVRVKELPLSVRIKDQNDNYYYSHSTSYDDTANQKTYSYIVPSGNYIVGYDNNTTDCNSSYAKYSTREDYSSNDYWYTNSGVTLSEVDATAISFSTVGETKSVDLEIVERPTVEFSPIEASTTTSADTITMTFSKPIKVTGTYIGTHDLNNNLDASILDELTNHLYFIEVDSNNDPIDYTEISGTITIVDDQTLIIALPPELVSGKRYQLKLYQSDSLKLIDEKGFSVAGKTTSIFLY